MCPKLQGYLENIREQTQGDYEGGGTSEMEKLTKLHWQKIEKFAHKICTKNAQNRANYKKKKQKPIFLNT